jgi:hypothetical protein
MRTNAGAFARCVPLRHGAPSDNRQSIRPGLLIELSLRLLNLVEVFGRPYPYATKSRLESCQPGEEPWILCKQTAHCCGLVGLWNEMPLHCSSRYGLAALSRVSISEGGLGQGMSIAPSPAILGGRAVAWKSSCQCLVVGVDQHRRCPLLDPSFPLEKSPSVGGPRRSPAHSHEASKASYPLASPIARPMLGGRRDVPPPALASHTSFGEGRVERLPLRLIRLLGPLSGPDVPEKVIPSLLRTQRYDIPSPSCSPWLRKSRDAFVEPPVRLGHQHLVEPLLRGAGFVGGHQKNDLSDWIKCIANTTPPAASKRNSFMFACLDALILAAPSGATGSIVNHGEIEMASGVAAAAVRLDFLRRPRLFRPPPPFLSLCSVRASSSPQRDGGRARIFPDRRRQR